MEDLNYQQAQLGDESPEGTKSSTSESTVDEIIFKRRYSFPIEGLEEDITDQIFQDQIDEIRNSLLDEKYKDNVYAESKPAPSAMQRMIKRKMINRRTQTYLRELL